MAVKDVRHGIAIRYDVAVELPRAAQLIFEQESVGAGGFTVNAVVRAHNRLCPALGNGGAEGRKISVLHVMFRGWYINRVPRRFRPAVHGKMLRRRDHAKILRVIALQSGDKSYAHPTRDKWILAVGFLPAPPARIAEDIDVRRPEVQALHDVAVSSARRLVMLRSPRS